MLFFKSKKKKKKKELVFIPDEDSNFEKLKNDFGAGRISASECLLGYVQHMKCHDELRVIENAAIFDILEDLLEEAVWRENRNPVCPEYDPNSSNIWLNQLVQVFEYHIDLIDEARLAVSTSDAKYPPTADTVVLETLDHIITYSMLDDIDDLRREKHELESMIGSKNYGPKDIVVFIKRNWNLLYSSISAYEMLAHCIGASKDHSYYNYFAANIRDLCFKFSN